jgi:hypothetical protein
MRDNINPNLCDPSFKLTKLISISIWSIGNDCTLSTSNECYRHIRLGFEYYNRKLITLACIVSNNDNINSIIKEKFKREIETILIQIYTGALVNPNLMSLVLHVINNTSTPSSTTSEKYKAINSFIQLWYVAVKSCIDADKFSESTPSFNKKPWRLLNSVVINLTINSSVSLIGKINVLCRPKPNLVITDDCLWSMVAFHTYVLLQFKQLDKTIKKPISNPLNDINNNGNRITNQYESATHLSIINNWTMIEFIITHYKPNLFADKLTMYISNMKVFAHIWDASKGRNIIISLSIF